MLRTAPAGRICSAARDLSSEPVRQVLEKREHGNREPSPLRPGQRQSAERKIMMSSDGKRQTSKFIETVETIIQYEDRGPKDKTGKPDWSVFPFTEAEEVLKVFEYGIQKYGAPFTYRKGIPIEELLAATIRHLVQIQNAVQMHDMLDNESYCLHAAHVAANALMMISQIQKQLKSEKAKRPAPTGMPSFVH